MNEDELRAAAAILKLVENAKTNSEVACAIARYREFVDVCSLRIREADTCTQGETWAIDSATDVQWWVAELDQYGNPMLFDGTHNCKKEAEDSIPLIRGTKTTRGQLAVARVEIYK